MICPVSHLKQGNVSLQAYFTFLLRHAANFDAVKVVDDFRRVLSVASSGPPTISPIIQLAYVVEMSRWVPIAPTKPGGPSKFPAARFTTVLKPSKPSARGSVSLGPFVGRWPETILLLVVEYLPVPDLPSVARANRALSRIVRDERGWEARCRILGVRPDAGE